MRHVVSVACYNPQGQILLGLRQDTRKWTLPSGHVEAGEDFTLAAVRELYEEAGLRALSLEFLGEEQVPGRDLTIHSYLVTANGLPTGENDPDHECRVWRWFQPDDLPEPLQVPDNCTLRALGLLGEEVHDHDGEFSLMMARGHRG